MHNINTVHVISTVFEIYVFCCEVILSRIKALLGVQLLGLELRWCKKNDKYQVCRALAPAAGVGREGPGG